MQFKEHLNKPLLKIIVKPNSSSNKIICYDPIKKALKVNIKSPATENKANKEIIKFFHKLTKKQVFITKGLKTKEKTLSIR